jgi:hypothetical protein
MNIMEPKTFTLEKLLEWLRQEAASQRSTLIVEARIAISAQEARVLDMQPTRPLDVIAY